MCLATNQSEPFIATHDIKCYKKLERRTTTMYKTPFIRSTILFKNGVCIQQCDKFGISCNYFHINEWYIFEGIHSLVYNPHHSSSYYLKIKIAIIPKGTKFYIGNCNDLVSLKLIIFKNKFRYWMYKIFRK